MNGGTTVEPAVSAAGHRRSAAIDSPTITVAEGYERWAPTYDHAPNPLLAREERHLLPLLSGLHHKRILDVACGTGRWLEKLIAHDGMSGMGIDSSVAMLRVAKKKASITGRLARAAGESLPLRNSVFDLAICSFALGHIRELGSVVRELARVTKPGADVFVSDLHPEAHARGWRVGFRDQSAAVQIEMLPRAPEDIVKAFCSNGFECVALMPLYLGEPEKPIFVRAGKVHVFAEVCQSPAVLACHFRRLGSPIESWKV
jgi:ubiquinone/menaquinone biosynthesis C-methylase UbiE